VRWQKDVPDAVVVIFLKIFLGFVRKKTVKVFEVLISQNIDVTAAEIFQVLLFGQTSVQLAVSLRNLRSPSFTVKQLSINLCHLSATLCSRRRQTR